MSVQKTEWFKINSLSICFGMVSIFSELSMPVSEKNVLPALPAYNTSYKAVPTDYYLFGANDSFIIHKRSLVYSYPQSVTLTR